MGKRHLIIADDDEDDRMLVLSAFSEDGIDVTIDFAEDGIQLMNLLSGKNRSEPPDLILLDLNMPRKDGREALREIKEDPVLKTIPVVIFTTAKNQLEIRRCYEMGANTYIIKPDSFDELKKAIANLSAYWLETAAIPLAGTRD